MKLAVIGTGYVGLVSGLCLAKIGHLVNCIDKNEGKIAMLKNGEVPIYEPGLEDLLAEMQKERRIAFATNLLEGLKDCEALFIAVGTPQNQEGEADLSAVFEVAEELVKIANNPELSGLKLIIVKSTVPIGTNQNLSKVLLEKCPNRFLTASNPEFLREGQAINDFMNPDLILLGTNSVESESILSKIYSYFPAEKIFCTDIKTAEIVKYGINSFLATKISFINQMADLCEKTGANIADFAKAIGRDERIGNKFLNPGPGFGGSCFPKDISALLNIAKVNQSQLPLVQSVYFANEQRIDLMIDKISCAANEFGKKLSECKIAIFGLAFKGGTDDIRCSPAMKIIKKLASYGAKISAHDFCAIDNARFEFAAENFEEILCYEDCYESAKGTDFLVIATEWQEYRELDFEKISKNMRNKVIVDLRNILPRKDLVQKGFKIYFVGGVEGQNLND